MADYTVKQHDRPGPLRATLRDAAGHAIDLTKFVRWFINANREAFKVNRITTADVSGFRDHLRRLD